jgi:hypothetical protein
LVELPDTVDSKSAVINDVPVGIWERAPVLLNQEIVGAEKPMKKPGGSGKNSLANMPWCGEAPVDN